MGRYVVEGAFKNTTFVTFRKMYRISFVLHVSNVPADWKILHPDIPRDIGLWQWVGLDPGTIETTVQSAYHATTQPSCGRKKKVEEVKLSIVSTWTLYLL